MSSRECSATTLEIAKPEVLWQLKRPQVEGRVDKVTQAKTGQRHTCVKTDKVVGLIVQKWLAKSQKVPVCKCQQKPPANGRVCLQDKHWSLFHLAGNAAVTAHSASCINLLQHKLFCNCTRWPQFQNLKSLQWKRHRAPTLQAAQRHFSCDKGS